MQSSWHPSAVPARCSGSSVVGRSSLEDETNRSTTTTRRDRVDRARSEAAHWPPVVVAAAVVARSAASTPLSPERLPPGGRGGRSHDDLLRAPGSEYRSVRLRWRVSPSGVVVTCTARMTSTMIFDVPRWRSQPHHHHRQRPWHSSTEYRFPVQRGLQSEVPTYHFGYWGGNVVLWEKYNCSIVLQFVKSVGGGELVKDLRWKGFVAQVSLDRAGVWGGA